MTYLKYLNLSKNNLDQIPTLSQCTSLIILNLKGNPLLWIESEVFAGLNEPTNLLVTNPSVCCYISSLQCITNEPPSPFLTCSRLLTFDFLRIFMWFMSIFGIFGNMYALYIGFKQRKRKKVQFLLINNLSISDLVMCVYLFILLSADINYTDYFPTNSHSWRKSTMCRFAGALSVLSSEASAFFITLISIDRFLGIKYPFGNRRISTSLAWLLIATMWTVATTFSIVSFIMSGDDSEFYSISEVCVGLPISKFKFYNESTIDVQTEYAIHNYTNQILSDKISQNV